MDHLQSGKMVMARELVISLKSEDVTIAFTDDPEAQPGLQMRESSKWDFCVMKVPEYLRDPSEFITF